MNGSFEGHNRNLLTSKRLELIPGGDDISKKQLRIIQGIAYPRLDYLSCTLVSLAELRPEKGRNAGANTVRNGVEETSDYSPALFLRQKDYWSTV